MSNLETRKNNSLEELQKELLKIEECTDSIMFRTNTLFYIKTADYTELKEIGISEVDSNNVIGIAKMLNIRVVRRGELSKNWTPQEYQKWKDKLKLKDYLGNMKFLTKVSGFKRWNYCISVDDFSNILEGFQKTANEVSAHSFRTAIVNYNPKQGDFCPVYLTQKIMAEEYDLKKNIAQYENMKQTDTDLLSMEAVICLLNEKIKEIK